VQTLPRHFSHTCLFLCSQHAVCESFHPGALMHPWGRAFFLECAFFRASGFYSHRGLSDVVIKPPLLMVESLFLIEGVSPPPSFFLFPRPPLRLSRWAPTKFECSIPIPALGASSQSGMNFFFVRFSFWTFVSAGRRRSIHIPSLGGFF